MNWVIRSGPAALALFATVLAAPVWADSQPKTPPPPPPSYADLADLADGAPLVIRAQPRKIVAVEPVRAPGVRAGWGRFYMNDNARYLSGEPGINLAAARWLTGQGVTAIGTDTMAVEVLPGEDDPAVKMPVHQHCLVEAGVYLIENLRLTPLVDVGITECCFILLPVKFKGATGSPARPIAMV